MSRPIYSIRFPLVIERTKIGRRVRKRLIADQTGLYGARACAAGMVTVAISEREDQPWSGCRNPDLHRRMMRLRMRASALWARVFAGQIDQSDPRLEAASNESHQIARRLFAETEAYLASA